MSDEKLEDNELTEKPVEKQEAAPGQPPNGGGSSYEKLRKLMEVAPNIRKMLGEIDAQKLDIKSRLEQLGGMFAAELKSLEVEGKVLTAEDKEIKKTLNEFKTDIEELFLEEKFKEKTVDTSRTVRGEELVEYAGRLERGEKLDSPAKERVAGVLERQNWGKILTSLQEGDRVLSWEVPGAEFLSIKYLNDKIFGPTETNKIIIEKRIVVEREMNKKFHANVELIQNDYKTEMFRVVKSSTGPKVTKDGLEIVAKVVDEEMTKFVSELANDLKKQEELALKPLLEKKEKGEFKDEEDKKLNEEEIKSHKDKVALLDKFADDLNGKSENTKGKEGFQMSWGLSEPIENGNSVEGKLLGITQSLQTSRIARGEGYELYGAEYADKQISRELRVIKDLRNKLAKESITDKDGNEFELFTKTADGKLALNKDVLRDVRKGKFVAKDDKPNNDLLKDVSKYIKKLNLLDAVKPFVFKDKEEVLEGAQERKVLAQKIKAGEILSETERARAVELLRSEEKDDNYTSKSEFGRAIEMDKCAYVSLDVLDIGVDQILDYESLLQDKELNSVKTEEEKIKRFSSLALEAGDKTTGILRDFSKKVAEICRRDEFKGLGFDGKLITAEIGGDELTLAVDTSVKNKEGLSKAKFEIAEREIEKKLEQLLFTLKKETEEIGVAARVIKTVVSKSEKIVLPESDHEKKVEAHLQALKRAEAGTAIAKDIEEAERKLTRLANKQGGEQAVKEKIGNLHELFVLDKVLKKGKEEWRVKSNVVVVEKDGVFKIGKFKVAKENKHEFDYKEISSGINSILGKKDGS